MRSSAEARCACASFCDRHDGAGVNGRFCKLTVLSYFFVSHGSLSAV